MIINTGLGLRSQYFQDLLEKKYNSIQWLEFLADQYFEVPEFLLKKLDQLREIYPCVLHSVNLSLASQARISSRYLKFLENLIHRYEPEWISDHLCFSKVGPIFTHDLLPIPWDYKILDRVARRIDLLQTRFKKNFLIENISSYFRFLDSPLSEAEFLKKLTQKTGCGLLLDINNIFVTADNHGESPEPFLQEIPFNSVKQIHLAGAEYHDGLWIDTHSRAVSERVLNCFAEIQAQHGPIPTCLEWDNDLPSFNKILEETQTIQKIIQNPQPKLSAEIEKSNLLFFPNKKIPEKNSKQNSESAWINYLTGDPLDLYKIISPTIFPNISPESRAHIYYKSMVGSREKILKKTFKPLSKILEPDLFDGCIFNYANENFVQDFNLNTYGEDFSDYLSQFECTKQFPYLKNLADFCYAWRQVYTQENIPGIYLSFDSPAYEIWKQCQPEYQGILETNYPSGIFEYLLYREGDKVKIKTKPLVFKK